MLVYEGLRHISIEMVGQPNTTQWDSQWWLGRKGQAESPEMCSAALQPQSAGLFGSQPLSTYAKWIRYMFSEITHILSCE